MNFFPELHKITDVHRFCNMNSGEAVKFPVFLVDLAPYCSTIEGKFLDLIYLGILQMFGMVLTIFTIFAAIFSWSSPNFKTVECLV